MAAVSAAIWVRRCAAVIAGKSTTARGGTRRGGRGWGGRGSGRRGSSRRRGGGRGDDIAENPLGPHGHEGCQEGDALGLGVVRAPPLDVVLEVHELHHRRQVVSRQGFVALVATTLLDRRRRNLGLYELKGCSTECSSRVLVRLRKDGRLGGGLVRENHQ